MEIFGGPYVSQFLDSQYFNSKRNIDFSHWDYVWASILALYIIPNLVTWFPGGLSNLDNHTLPFLLVYQIQGSYLSLGLSWIHLLLKTDSHMLKASTLLAVL